MANKINQEDMPVWQRDAKDPTEGHSCRIRDGRQYIFQMRTGADPVLAVEAFAREKGIKYGKINTAYMGAFQPLRYYKWVVDKTDPEKWHCEFIAEDKHLLTLGAIGGMIGQRPTREGGWETFAAIHFVAGGAWDAGNVVGHLAEGSRVKGCMQFIITELLDIEVETPIDEYGIAFTEPENFYRNIKGDE